MEARAEVLRRLDAGTLTFPAPHQTTRTDGLGWFEVSLEEHGLVVIECADETLFHAPSNLSFLEPDFEVSALPPGGEGTIEGKVLVINPWTRRTAVADPSSWPQLPSALVHYAWATTLEGKPLVMAPSSGLLSDGSNGGFATMFGGPPIPRPAPVQPENAVAVTVRVALRDGLTRRQTSMQLMASDGGLTGWVETRTAAHAFRVAPGPYVAQVRMPGAKPAAVALDVSAPKEVAVTLEPGVAMAGRVVDVRGQPVSGATVEVNGEAATGTDATGAFTLADEGPKRLRAWHPSVGVSESLDVAEAGPVKLVLTPRSDVRIRVEAPDGGVVFGVARILRHGVSEEVTRTAAFDSVLVRQSELTLAGLSPGHHRLLVLTSEWAATRLEFDVGVEPLLLTQRLGEKPVIEGIVTRGGKPVVGARVKFARPEPIFSHAEEVTRTDERGAFRLRRSLPGEATLEVDGARVKVSVPSSGQRIELKPR
ncbi:MAG: hypothetical protein AB1938_07115 [Myxococcota bacterium]